jgi:peptide/nickel transport system substrate-binding protein
MTRRNVMVTGAGLAGASLLAVSPLARAQARTTINVRVPAEFTGIDPFHRTLPVDGNVAGAVFQRLMQHKPNSAEMELDAAAEVKQVSPTVLEFRLKPGMMFTDGFGEMTAEDVKFSYERIAFDPKDGSKPSSYKGDFLYLTQVEVKSKYEGRIILSQPRANLIDTAVGDFTGSIVSKRAVEQRGADHITKPIGSGPYRIAAYDRQKGVQLKRNADYKGTRKAGFEEMNIKVITDAKTAELAIRAGELDFAVMSPSEADPLRGATGITVSDQPSIAYVFMGMNTEKAPLNDLRVRQAIRLALDVDQMLMAGYNGKVPRLNTLLPPMVNGHWREAPVYRRNVAEARALLAAAGASNVRLKITVLNRPEFQNMAVVAKALLAEIGITLDVDAQAGGTYWSSGQGDTGKNLDLYIARFSGKHDPNFIMQWFVSGQIGRWNWSRFNSPEFDAAFKASDSELDPAKRRQQVIDAQRAMDRSAAYVWLTNEANTLVHRNWVRPASIPGWLNWQYQDFSAV